ncbi:hypothetical protein Pint_20645 [Pistacia integerrima]|uniref:Uncharacterized protein n=1 Tax=Pistacia integerrima TaxID=434235 RepID=A0ACC0XCT8_9ROSI|nr:hypothetical protein Pint_20645 [Pistacia integerrima]
MEISAQLSRTSSFRVLESGKVEKLIDIAWSIGNASSSQCDENLHLHAWDGNSAIAEKSDNKFQVDQIWALYNDRDRMPKRQIAADTKVHGIIGKPIGHSKSPHLYISAFRAPGFNGIYLPLLVDSVADFINTYSSPDFVGYSYTIPHKEDGLRCCDEIDPIAKEIGAISCMIRRPTDGKLMGYNVDCLGAIAAIEEALRASNGAPASGSPLAGKLFVVMGAGGAGKALAYGGYEKGARVVVANRTYAKAKELAGKVGGQSITLDELKDFHPEEGMILANTTSVGMKPRIEDSPLPKEALKHYSLVFDAIYTPKWTRLLQEAKECGAIVVFGTEMFINQAFVQVERFTGLPAPKQLMRDVLARNMDKSEFFW